MIAAKFHCYSVADAYLSAERYYLGWALRMNSGEHMYIAFMHQQTQSMHSDTYTCSQTLPCTHTQHVYVLTQILHSALQAQGWEVRAGGDAVIWRHLASWYPIKAILAAAKERSLTSCSDLGVS